MSSLTSHSRHHSRRRFSNNKDICIDSLFPSDIKAGTRGHRLDVESLFSGTPLNNDPTITFTSDILLDRINKRRQEKLKCYNSMLKYCHDRITTADDVQGTDLIFSVVESFPECKEYEPRECLEYISTKLRMDLIDTTILSDTTLFVTWKYLELKREAAIEATKAEKAAGKTTEQSKTTKDIIINKTQYV